VKVPPSEAPEVRRVAAFKELPRDSVNVRIEGIRSAGEGGNVRDIRCYDPGPYHQFSLIFHHFILRSQSLVPHLFPYAPLGPPPNHLKSHLMDHLTIPQSDITCHHSTVCSTPQHHHLTHYGLLAHCHVMMELYLELPTHDEPYYM